MSNCVAKIYPIWVTYSSSINIDQISCCYAVTTLEFGLLACTTDGTDRNELGLSGNADFMFLVRQSNELSPVSGPNARTKCAFWRGYIYINRTLSKLQTRHNWLKWCCLDYIWFKEILLMLSENLLISLILLQWLEIKMTGQSMFRVKTTVVTLTQLLWSKTL